MNTLSYESYLGTSNGSKFGGEPLPQGIVTDQCNVAQDEYLKRQSREGTPLYTGPDAKPIDKSKYRVFEHDLCLAFIDNLGHQPVLMNFDTRSTTGVSKAFTRQVYERAGMSSMKLAAFPNVFSALNSVKVETNMNWAASMFPNPASYNAFYAFLREPANEIPKEIQDYFPDSYHHFLAHFAFRLIGTAKTNDHKPKERTDVPVNIGGLVHPFATKLAGPNEVMEWYLPFPNEIATLPEIVKHTGSDSERIIVGLRPSLSTYTQSILQLAARSAAGLDAGEKFKLSIAIETFLNHRVCGEALRTAIPGTTCYLSLCRGPYCL